MPKSSKEDLLARYEATGDERDYLAAKKLFERAIKDEPASQVFLDYGYLLYCHGRNSIRQSLVFYELALELDESNDKAHYQTISSYAALQESELAIETYQERFAASPGDLREHMFLSRAYLANHQYASALEVINLGLAISPHNALLFEFRGEAWAGLGDHNAALNDWERSFELDMQNLAPLYMSAFLYARLGRLAKAKEAWLQIIRACEERGFDLDVLWPKRELEKLDNASQ